MAWQGSSESNRPKLTRAAELAGIVSVAIAAIGLLIQISQGQSISIKVEGNSGWHGWALAVAAIVYLAIELAISFVAGGIYGLDRKRERLYSETRYGGRRYSGGIPMGVTARTPITGLILCLVVTLAFSDLCGFHIWAISLGIVASGSGVGMGIFIGHEFEE
jgi:hypothetical protein